MLCAENLLILIYNSLQTNARNTPHATKEGRLKRNYKTTNTSSTNASLAIPYFIMLSK